MINKQSYGLGRKGTWKRGNCYKVLSNFECISPLGKSIQTKNPLQAFDDNNKKIKFTSKNPDPSS